ncbi:MAG: YIP1 family protein, partial [Chloroflexi bacterium]|nr:YIP1 family protein [Chloroflexota bacterium]
LFQGEATFWEMARTLGYANAPTALGLLAFIPCVGPIISLAAWVLSLIVGFYAVREALDLPTDKSILTIIIGWIVVVVVSIVVGVVFGAFGALL